MFQELLLALQGYPGAVFVESKDGFSVAMGAALQHPLDRVVLNELCVLGYHVRLLKRFVQSEDVPGFYLDALRVGLGEVLEGYADALVDAEREAPRGTGGFAAFLRHRLEKYRLLFPPLLGMVEHIRTNKVRGCSVLGVVHERSLTGTPILKETLDRLLLQLRRVLVRQCVCWTVRGVLHDPFDEFFVCGGDEVGAPPATSGFSDVSYGHCLRPRLLPDCIPTSLASKILFAGNAVRILPSSKGSQTAYGDAEERLLRRGTEMENGGDPSLRDLEDFAEDVRSRAASYLWHMFVDEAGLVSQLHLLRDTFLLGDPELFQQFMEAADSLLSCAPGDDTEFEVDEIFRGCCGALRPEEEDAGRLTVVLRPPPDDAPGEASGWDRLGLSYEAGHPLRIFFTPSALAKYDRLFRFLSTVRRTRLSLQGQWLRCTKDKGDRPRTETRLRMAALVQSLDCYLQTDVVEAAFDRLLRRVSCTRDFESVRHAHGTFLSELLAGTFILLHPLHVCIQRILALCRTFCVPLPTNDVDLESVAKKFETEEYLLFRIVHTLAEGESGLHPSRLLLRLDFSGRFSRIQKKPL